MATPASPSPAPSPSSSASGSRRRPRWGLIAFIVLVVVPVTAFALYTWGALNFVYSRGERAGYAQKISKKGWLCKTWEGELTLITMPGVPPQTWEFTVRNDSIAQYIAGASLGKRVSLTYEQHKGIPLSCFGDTEYFVVGARVVDQP
jgi:hypothetical protein